MSTTCRPFTLRNFQICPKDAAPARIVTVFLGPVEFSGSSTLNAIVFISQPSGDHRDHPAAAHMQKNGPKWV